MKIGVTGYLRLKLCVRLVIDADTRISSFAKTKNFEKLFQLFISGSVRAFKHNIWVNKSRNTVPLTNKALQPHRLSSSSFNKSIWLHRLQKGSAFVKVNLGTLPLLCRKNSWTIFIAKKMPFCDELNYQGWMCVS